MVRASMEYADDSESNDEPPSKGRGRHFWSIVAGLALMVPSWVVLWIQSWYINPLLFATLWSGATLTMYGLGPGYPGVRRHLTLAALSVPVWWWFELVNDRVVNWRYVGSGRYTDVEYAIFASVAFATVIPALDAAWRLLGVRSGLPQPRGTRARSALPLLVAGVGCHVLLFAWPSLFFPLVWVGPLLVLASLAGLVGGRTLVGEARWWRSTAWRVAGAGLLCGFLWEMWNFWAFPKWEYHIPHFDFLHVFEMPLLGYGGYIPFAWSLYLLVSFGSMLRKRLATRGQADGRLAVDTMPSDLSR